MVPVAVAVRVVRIGIRQYTGAVAALDRRRVTGLLLRVVRLPLRRGRRVHRRVVGRVLEQDLLLVSGEALAVIRFRTERQPVLARAGVVGFAGVIADVALRARAG